jgi:hypothetical protein
VGWAVLFIRGVSKSFGQPPTSKYTAMDFETRRQRGPRIGGLQDAGAETFLEFAEKLETDKRKPI